MEQPHGDARSWFGSHLRDLRVEAGLTLRELEKRTSISRSALAGYFSGERLPSDSNLLKITEAFGLDPAESKELHSKWAYALDQEKPSRSITIRSDEHLAGELAEAVDEDGYAVLWLNDLMMVKTPEIMLRIDLVKIDMSRLSGGYSSTKELAHAIIRLATTSANSANLRSNE